MPSKSPFQDILAGIEQLARLADVDQVLLGLSRLLKKTVKSSWAVVYLLDRESHDFAPARSAGLPARYRRLFQQMPLAPEQIPVLKKFLRSKRHMVIADAGQDNQLNPLLRRLLRHLTLLAVPMVVRNQVVGAVFVARHKSYPPFKGDEIAIIKEVVSHASLQVSNIRLFDDSLDMAVEMAKRVDVIITLDEINKAISSSLSNERVIETALEQIERVISYDLVGVLTGGKEGLAVMAAHGNKITVPDLLKPGAIITLRGIVMDVYQRGESRYRADLQSSRRLPPFDRAMATAGIATLLAIPLLSKGVCTGVLLLGSIQPGRFAREETFVTEKIAAQLAVAMANAHLYEEMRALFFSTITSLANAIDAKSPWTKGHSERVMHLAARIASLLGLPEAVVEKVRLGGLLHDIGKIGIIEALLEKPAMLSEDEFPPLRLHPEKGVAILAPIEQLQEVLPAILHHHERYDGTGYPSGLAGEDIPLEARIITVADSFDAMVVDRPYRQKFSVSAALAEMERCAGSQFDPKLVELLIRIVTNRPIATPGKIVPDR